jgi:hypothetical protein
MANEPKPKEVVVKVPAHLLEADTLVLQKVAGKYKVAGSARADTVCETQDPGGACNQCEPPGKVGVNMIETLRHDMRTMKQKMEDLTKNMNARHGELKKMLGELKKPK